MKNVFLLLGLIMLILAACQDGESPQENLAVPPTEAAESTPPAEEEAAVEPTAEPPVEEEVVEEPTAEAEAEEEVVEEPQAETAITSWDALLEQTMASCGAPGAVLLVDSPEGRYLQAIGLASTEDGTELQVTDALEIGSNTKSFTTAIAVQLQEEGVWSLDDPLSQWLPDVAARLPYGDEITLRQMAQNHSGIWDYANPLIGEAISSGNYEQGYTPEEIVDYIVENGEPVAEPGTDVAWNYSSSNYHILAMAIEAVTGQRLADLYQERIFTPLGMEDSFLLEGVPEPGQIVNGYYTEEGETFNTTSWNASQGWAAGGIVSTAEDMARYVEGLSAGDLFQDPNSLEQMLDFGDGFVANYLAYGLGIGSYTGYGDLVGYGHGGQTAGFQSLWAVFPEQEVNLVLLTNSASCSVTFDFMAPLAENSQLLTSGGATSPAGEDSSDTEEESADAAPPAPLPDEIVAQLDEFLGAQLYTEGMNPQSGAPGVILLVDRPDGRYLQAAGVASLEEGTPIQVNDRVEIGSNTKSFTIALLMQLQEEGVLSMDDPLSAWLPEWADLIPYGDEITLRQMAQHTSGIWDYGDLILGEVAAHPVHLQDFYTPEELVQYAIDNGTPDFTPGEEGQWKYNNTGYILLGMVLEAATGEKLGDLYQTRIFDPLGLESAVFIEDVPVAHEIINGYWWTEDGHELNTTKWNVSQGWSAGGIAMTAEDLLTYGQALAAGELFQDPGSLEKMLAFDPDGMDGYMPAGLGLLDFSLVGAPGSWGHEGQTAGFQTLWFTNPQSGVTVVGLSNSAAYQGFNFLKVASIVSPEP